MKLRTDGPGRFHSPSAVGHQPPVRRCFNTSCLASWKAISRLGARWFEKIEQNLKIALKHSNTSVATPTRGPKRIISAFKCTRRWSLTLDVIFEGSIKANRSSTFAAATLTSDYKKDTEKIGIRQDASNLQDILPYSVFLVSTRVRKVLPPL